MFKFRGLLGVSLLSVVTACSAAAPPSPNEMAVAAEQDRTMREAIMDVDAAMAEASAGLNEASAVNASELAQRRPSSQPSIK